MTDKLGSIATDQPAHAKQLQARRRKRILTLEIFTVVAVIASLQVYFNFLGLVAEVAHGFGHDRAAEILYGQALGVQIKVRGWNSPAVSDLLDDIAYFYYDTDRSENAIPIVERSLAICRTNFGAGAPRCAWTLSLKGLIYAGSGHYREAEKIAREALPILEGAYGRQTWAVSTTLNRLGLALEGEERFAEAEASFQESLAIRERLYGPRSYTLVPILRNLARVYSDEGKEEDASAALRRADSIAPRR